MGMTDGRRCAARVGLAACVCVAALAGTGQAQAATTAYPTGASTFDGDPGGWTGSAASCGPINPIALLCSATNTHDAGIGDPPGSIATNVTVTLNVLSTFTGTGTWTSPQFRVSAGSPVASATFSYDRRVDSGSLTDLTPTSNVEVSLIDETAGVTTPVLTETLTNALAAFAPHGASVSPEVIVDGHTYRLRIVTTTTSSVASVTGQASTRFDDVGLTVETAGGTDLENPGTIPGGNTPLVSPGVRVIRGPYSNREIASIINRFSIETDRGPRSGGSLVPLALCTVVGTAGNDRILGTRGNDVICGLGGNDVLVGGGGRDLIDGANGADRINGGSGRDKLLALAGRDRVAGDRAGDRIGGGAGRDRLGGGRGRDRISGGSGRDRLLARDRMRDRVRGGRGRDSARVDSATGSRRAPRRSDRVRGVERLI